MQKSFTIIDVRTEMEVRAGMIPTAQHIPVDQIPSAFSLSDQEFEEEYGFAKPKENIIFYCKAGVRSENATKFLRSMGYKNVKNYKGSWLEWKQHN